MRLVKESYVEGKRNTENELGSDLIDSGMKRMIMIICYRVCCDCCLYHIVLAGRTSSTLRALKTVLNNANVIIKR